MPTGTTTPAANPQQQRMPARQGTEAMLAQIRADMEALRVRDMEQQEMHRQRLDIRMDNLEDAGRRTAMDVDRLRTDLAASLDSQRENVNHLATEVAGIVTYLRGGEMPGQVASSTPPAYHPPSMLLSTPVFPSISSFGRSLTNNVFTPDTSMQDLQVGASIPDISPVTRTMTQPSPRIVTGTWGLHPSPPPPVSHAAAPVPPPTMPSRSPMPSPGTLFEMLTGPTNPPENGQSISAPLGRHFGPRSRQQGRSVSNKEGKHAGGRKK